MVVLPANEFADIRKRCSASILKIRGSHPFFGVLALFAELTVDEAVGTAATDGMRIRIAPDFVRGLTPTQCTGVLLHEILHCALEHVSRRGRREPMIWNAAADIVVNGMIRDSSTFDLPNGSVEDEELAHLSTEEVYERLALLDKPPAPALVDLDSGNTIVGAIGARGRREIRSHWTVARNKAMAVARKAGFQFGNVAGREWRDVLALSQPMLDWRTTLWEFVARTPSNYSGFDRRFVSRGLYVEALDGETVDIWVAIDTSGSISDLQLREFMSELIGITTAYPSIRARLYFTDTDIYGPHELSDGLEMPTPRGGGGTSFVPFFEALRSTEKTGTCPLLAIYFTDGFGEFPVNLPDAKVLWVVTEGGLSSRDFPFGSVVRMSSGD